MNLFHSNPSPVFLKRDSDLEAQKEALISIRPQYSEEVQAVIDEDLKILEYGIAGEKRIAYELENSHIPMYIIHDLFLEHEGLSAQIDYLIFTRKCFFVVECKNLYGSISIASDGTFTRTVQTARGYRKEGIYSPITQNRRHLELIKAIVNQSLAARIGNLFLDGFESTWIPVVCIANEKTVVNDRYAGKAIRNQIVRHDGLVRFIRNHYNACNEFPMSDKETRETAEKWLQRNVPNPTDYLAKYDRLQAEAAAGKPEKQTLLCPKCGAPMVLRTAARGANAGRQFYGCSRYPACRGIVNLG